MTPLGKLAKRLNALARRERVLIFAAIACLIWGLAYSLAIDPALSRAKAARAATAERRAQLVMQRGIVEELGARLRQDVNAAVNAELEKSTTELASVDSGIRGLHRTLIPAQEMGQVLDGLLRKEAGVRLIALRNLPAEPVIVDDGALSPARSPADGAPEKARLYRHGIELVVEGGYFDLLNYLAQVEKQPWRMLWSETELTARYPVSRLQLRLHTLSLDESWLSV